jgi:hypothetical protein
MVHIVSTSARNLQAEKVERINAAALYEYMDSHRRTFWLARNSKDKMASIPVFSPQAR